MTTEQGDRNEAQGEANAAQGAANKDNIEQLTEVVEALVTSSKQNDQGIGTVAALMHEATIDRRMGRTVLTLLLIFLTGVGWAFYNDLNHARLQRDDLLNLVESNVQTLQDLETLSKQLVASTDPTGCVAMRSEAFRAEAVRRIQNDIRSYHAQKPLPPDPAIESLIAAPCPGETKP